MEQNDYLLGSDEIAKRLGCNRNFVGDLINSGLLSVLRFGRTRKVRNSTLNQFLQKYEGCNLHELVKKTPVKQRQVKMMGYIHYPMKGGEYIERRVSSGQNPSIFQFEEMEGFKPRRCS